MRSKIGIPSPRSGSGSWRGPPGELRLAGIGQLRRRGQGSGDNPKQHERREQGDPRVQDQRGKYRRSKGILRISACQARAGRRPIVKHAGKCGIYRRARSLADFRFVTILG